MMQAVKEATCLVQKADLSVKSDLQTFSPLTSHSYFLSPIMMKQGMSTFLPCAALLRMTTQVSGDSEENGSLVLLSVP